jgi:hypothetical protein
MGGALKTSTDPDRSPIFVVGTGRSGTTLLRMILNAHPRIYLTHEASFYLGSTGRSRELGVFEWFQRYVGTLAFAWLKVDAGEVKKELAGDSDDGQFRAFSAVMRCKAGQYKKPRYGDKTPLHSAYLQKIFEDYPDPRVIHVVRDPRGSVGSLLRMPWASGSVALNSFYCDRQMKMVRPFADRIHEIRLEELLADPAGVMKGVLEFVREPWDPAVLDHENHAPKDDLPPFPWFLSAGRNIKAPTGEPAWRRELSPVWIRIVERMNRYGMTRYGYEPARLDPRPGLFARMGARLKELPEVFRSIGRMARFARLCRKKELPDPQVAMEALLSINPAAWKRYPDFKMPRVPGPADL